MCGIKRSAAAVAVAQQRPNLVSLSLVFSHCSSISYCHIRGVCILPRRQIPDGCKHSQFIRTTINQTTSQRGRCSCRDSARRAQGGRRPRPALANARGASARSELAPGQAGHRSQPGGVSPSAPRTWPASRPCPTPLPSCTLAGGGGGASACGGWLRAARAAESRGADAPRPLGDATPRGRDPSGT